MDLCDYLSRLTPIFSRGYCRHALSSPRVPCTFTVSSAMSEMYLTLGLSHTRHWTCSYETIGYDLVTDGWLLLFGFLFLFLLGIREWAERERGIIVYTVSMDFSH